MATTSPTLRLHPASVPQGPHLKKWPRSTELQSLQRLLFDSKLDFAHLSEQIQQFPELADYFLKRINSVHLGYTRRIHSLRHALVLMGTKSLEAEFDTLLRQSEHVSAVGG
ncbi:MAG: HDOD domain-containing protein [Planctomycetaceae bacterium]